MEGASFDSTKTPLEDLLRAVASGSMQLPDFQRSWVWDDDRIRSLLASVSVSFPIGAIMTLSTGGEAIFKPRLLEGAEGAAVAGAETLLLDGQQRMTSLFQALMADTPVRTRDSRGKVVHRHYYIDIKSALNPDSDRDEWIISVPEDKIIKSLRTIDLDLSTPGNEHQEGMFPANRVFDSKRWAAGFRAHWENELDAVRQFDDFDTKIIERFEKYHLPVIELGRSTPVEAVCLIFEKVNRGGVPLGIFELLTAKLAGRGFQLRENWERQKRDLETRYTVLGDLKSDEFLQVVALLTTIARRENNPGSAIGCRRREILGLSLDEYNRFAPLAAAGFAAAAQFLHGEYILRSRDVPYRSQLVPLAAILAHLGNDAKTAKATEMLRRWYWNGVLGETYGGSTETIFARDLPEVSGWIRGGGTPPSTVGEANFQASRLRTLRTRNSAAYKGIYALLMREGCRDFVSGQTLKDQADFQEPIDIHHVFPQAWYRRRSDISPDDGNSIINKTAISARTNRRIGGRAPSAYCRTLLSEVGSEQAMSDIFESHRIDIAFLQNDDFWGFYRDRARRLLRLIADAMGKDVTMDDNAFAPDAPVDEYDDGPPDYADAAS